VSHTEAQLMSESYQTVSTKQKFIFNGSDLCCAFFLFIVLVFFGILAFIFHAASEQDDASTGAFMTETGSHNSSFFPLHLQLNFLFALSSPSFLPQKKK